MCPCLTLTNIYRPSILAQLRRRRLPTYYVCIVGVRPWLPGFFRRRDTAGIMYVVGQAESERVYLVHSSSSTLLVGR